MAELTQEVVIVASPATIFPFLVDPEQHVRWMGTEAELDARVGGTHRVLVQGRHPSAGEFVEVVPNERVVFTFGWDEPGHPIPARSTQVEITLIPDGDKTRVSASCTAGCPTTRCPTTRAAGATISNAWPQSSVGTTPVPTSPRPKADEKDRDECQSQIPGQSP